MTDRDYAWIDRLGSYRKAKLLGQHLHSAQYHLIKGMRLLGIANKLAINTSAQGAVSINLSKLVDVTLVGAIAAASAETNATRTPKQAQLETIFGHVASKRRIWMAARVIDRRLGGNAVRTLCEAFLNGSVDRADLERVPDWIVITEIKEQMHEELGQGRVAMAYVGLRMLLKKMLTEAVTTTDRATAELAQPVAVGGS